MPSRTILPMRPIIQILIIFIGVCFDAYSFEYNQNNYIHPFMLRNDPTWWGSHIYFICEHIKFITMAILALEGSRTLLDKLFIYLAIADIVDYFLTNNAIWYRLPLAQDIGLPVSINTLSLIIFGYYFILAKWNSLHVLR